MRNQRGRIIRRVSKTVLLTLLFVPLAILLMFFAANRFAGQSQTGTIARRISDSGAQVLGRYTFVGNVGVFLSSKIVTISPKKIKPYVSAKG